MPETYNHRSTIRLSPEFLRKNNGSIGRLLSVWAAIFCCTAGWASVSSDFGQQSIEAYRSVLDVTSFSKMQQEGMLSGWRFRAGDLLRSESGIGNIGDEGPENPTPEETMPEFCQNGERETTVLSPAVLLDPELRSVTVGIMAEGGGEARVDILWMRNDAVLDTMPLRAAPPSPDGRRRFNLSETPKPEVADALRLVLYAKTAPDTHFCWQTARIAGVFVYTPEIKLFRNLIGYEQVAPKHFTVWANFLARAAGFTLFDEAEEVVFRGRLKAGEHILGGCGSAWHGYYYQGDFSEVEVEGDFTLEVQLDDSAQTEARIEIGFNLLWEKAFLPAVLPFRRQRTDENADDLHFWNDSGVNTPGDAALLWDLARSWSLLRYRFPNDSPLKALEEEVVYGTSRAAHWVLNGNSETAWNYPDFPKLLNALSCIAGARNMAPETLDAARTLLLPAMQENRRGSWYFTAAMDLYRATEEEQYLKYAADIFDGCALERVEPLLDFEALTGESVTVQVRQIFGERGDLWNESAKNAFGIPCSGNKGERGFFLAEKHAEPPFFGNSARLLAAAEFMAQAYRYTSNPEYLNFVYNQINWLMGNNPFGTCLISGLGSSSEPLVVVAGTFADPPPQGTVLHGIGPVAVDDDSPRFVVSSDDAPDEYTNGYSLRNNARYLSTMAYLKRIPVARPRQ